MNNENFFPTEDYKLPVTSNYMKFTEGENTFRVLSSAIVGYEYFNTQNKPVRSKEAFDSVPDDIKKDKDGKFKISHFWAFIVYNYDANRIQVLELTQKGLMKYIQGLVKNEKWGNPTGYDITVTRTGAGLDTEYTIMSNPHSGIDPAIIEQYKNKSINLKALYAGEDPFAE